MQVVQYGYRSDNLGYIIHSGREAAVVDPGDYDFIFDYLNTNKLVLKYLLNTHLHFDHMMENETISRFSGVITPEFKDLSESSEESLELGEEKLFVIPSPGHTLDSLCFKGDGFVVTGDTLFIANIGNCFSGEYETYTRTLARLLSLPDETRVYPGHDYTDMSLERAGKVEPGNPEIGAFIERYSSPPVVTTIGDEKKINPFLRREESEVVAYLKSRGWNVDTPIERLKSVLKLK